MVAVSVMFSGIAVIGALASILASLLVSSPAEPGEPVAEQVMDDEHTTPIPAPERAILDELSHLRTEITATRQDLEGARSELAELRAALTAPGHDGQAPGP